MLSTTDARGKTISYTYDADGRKTAEYDTTGSAPESRSRRAGFLGLRHPGQGPAHLLYRLRGGRDERHHVHRVRRRLQQRRPATGSTAKRLRRARWRAPTSSQSDTAPTETWRLSYEDSAAGGLPGTEKVYIGYDTADDPTSLTSSLWDYVPTLSYTELGQPLEYTFGTTTEPASLLNSYDPATNRLTRSVVTASSNSTIVDDTTYSYDNAGLITSEADTPAGGPAQVQCFPTTTLAGCTTGWSQGASGCPAGPSQSAESGAAAPYWEQYTYNNENDLTSEISTPATGLATTTTFGYPAAGIGAAARGDLGAGHRARRHHDKQLRIQRGRRRDRASPRRPTRRR